MLWCNSRWTTPNAELLPGGFASVSLDLPGGDAGVLSIPPSALIFDKSGLRVATVVMRKQGVLQVTSPSRVDFGKGDRNRLRDSQTTIA